MKIIPIPKNLFLPAIHNHFPINKGWLINLINENKKVDIYLVSPEKQEIELYLKDSSFTVTRALSVPSRDYCVLYQDKSPTRCLDAEGNICEENQFIDFRTKKQIATINNSYHNELRTFVKRQYEIETDALIVLKEDEQLLIPIPENILTTVLSKDEHTALLTSKNNFYIVDV